MKSVADSVAADTERLVANLSASERVELALSLGQQAVEAFAAANQVSLEEARRILRKNNQIGRRRSVNGAIDDE